MATKWIHAPIRCALVCATASVACASEVGVDPAPTAVGQSTALPGALEAPEAVHELLSVDWELAPGTEEYLCTRRTLSETYYASSILAISPQGTHHVLLSIGDKPDAADGTRECDAAETFPTSLGGGGVGTQARDLPDGVAEALPAGSQLLINTHLFNVTDQPLRGHSGVMFKTMDPSAVRVLADSQVMGPTKLEVPPGRSTSVGGCTLARDATYFGIMPHMHQTGVAMKVVARTRTRGELLLFDGPYSFDSQVIHPLDITLSAGDYVEVSCSFDNAQDRTLHWGESSKDEMCQVGMGRLPAGGASVCNH